MIVRLRDRPYTDTVRRSTFMGLSPVLILVPLVGKPLVAQLGPRAM